MRPNANIPSSERCALTARLRYRAQAAEADAARVTRKAKAEVARIRAEAEAAIAKAQAQAEAAWARTEALHDAIASERAELTAHLESPAWERDLLTLARDRVRAELLDLSLRHRSCGTCGSFGRAFSEQFLQAEIDALTRDHDLPSVPPLSSADWPVEMGRITRQGRGLNASWHTPEPAPPKRRQAIW